MPVMPLIKPLFYFLFHSVFYINLARATLINHCVSFSGVTLIKYVTLHGKTGTKVIACSEHASTSKQKNLILARLRHVQNLASLLNLLFHRTR